MNPKRSLFFIAFLLFAGVDALLFSGSSNKGKNALYEVKVRPNFEAPELDGQLSQGEWRKAGLINNFTQKEPDEGQPASEPTFILITYDEENIYFGIRCFDSKPAKIVANEMRRDYNLSDNDYVEIIIDTFHDQRNAYYFATNSLGARLDCEIKAEGQHLNWDWDGVWRSVARRDEFGWTAEVAIPFQTLRFQNQESLTWGINFGRYIPRKGEESYWSPISRNDDFDDFGKFKASKFGTLRGLSNIKHQNRFEFKPYTIGGVERNFVVNNTEKQADIGLDTKFHITSNIISDLTINPDFAQVEADAEQINLSRFNLFFPEKREFFIEGLDVFNVGEESGYEPFTLLFFSRRIGLHRDAQTSALKEQPIMGGIKVTGKEGPYEIGLLNVLTDELNYQNSFGLQRSVPRTNFSAFRLKRDIFQRSYIGFMGLSKDETEDGHYNRTFAMDARFSFDNNLKLGGYVAKTETPGLDGDDFNSYADVSWGNDLFSAGGSFTDIGKNFNPEMGFLQWRDIRKYNLELTFSPRPQFLNTRKTYFSYNLEYITDHNDELQYRTIGGSIYNQFNDQSYLFLGLTNYYDNLPDSTLFLGTYVPGGIYRYNVAGLTYVSDLSKKISGSIQLGAGNFYDGPYYQVSLSNYLRPSNRFGLDLQWSWYRTDVPFPAGSSTRFTSNIFSARFNYSFTTDLFIKTYVQWNSVRNRVISNILLNFIHSPGSDFYLVYNEEWNTRGGFDTTNRTLLAKITYLFKF